MSRFNFGGAGNTPPVVKNLIIINVAMFIAFYLFDSLFRINLNRVLGLYYIQSDTFQPWQIVTHMFMHGGFIHILFNMWALWIFGKTLESVWGSKRFLTYYLVTGLGAAAMLTLVNFIQVYSLATKISPADFDMITSQGNDLILQGQNYVNPVLGKLNLLLHTPTVGASGAVFGLLLAFGMLFPNTPLMIIPIPVPIKAKWLVIGYGVLELYLGLTQANSNIAHFAHLGGMIFGFILIKYWNKRSRNFY